MEEEEGSASYSRRQRGPLELEFEDAEPAGARTARARRTRRRLVFSVRSARRRDAAAATKEPSVRKKSIRSSRHPRGGIDTRDSLRTNRRAMSPDVSPGTNGSDGPLARARAPPRVWTRETVPRRWTRVALRRHGEILNAQRNLSPAASREGDDADSDGMSLNLSESDREDRNTAPPPPRTSNVELEVDVLAEAILNPREFSETRDASGSGSVRLVPSLRSAWDEEKRRAALENRAVPPPPPPASRLPFAETSVAKDEHRKRLLARVAAAARAEAGAGVASSVFKRRSFNLRRGMFRSIWRPCTTGIRTWNQRLRRAEIERHPEIEPFGCTDRCVDFRRRRAARGPSLAFETPARPSRVRGGAPCASPPPRAALAAAAGEADARPPEQNDAEASAPGGSDASPRGYSGT